MQAWVEGSSTTSSGSRNNVIDEDGCVSLLRITSESSTALTEADIRGVCPSLELKDYQLVGINWLKLLHQNNVNGVLADGE